MKTGAVSLLMASFFLAASVGLANAQAQDPGHEGHHPPEGAADSPEPTPPVQAGPGPSPAVSGTTPGMGMGAGGMMQGMGAMSGGDTMMRSMMMGGARRSGHDVGMMSHERIDGRIAFLHAELKITPAQEPQWKAFADALRAGAAKIKPFRQQMMKRDDKTTDWMERLTRSEQALEAHLGALKSLKAAAGPLFAILSEEQKKTAEELLSGPMGM